MYFWEEYFHARSSLNATIVLHRLWHQKVSSIDKNLYNEKQSAKFKLVWIPFDSNSN